MKKGLINCSEASKNLTRVTSILQAQSKSSKPSNDEVSQSAIRVLKNSTDFALTFLSDSYRNIDSTINFLQHILAYSRLSQTELDEFIQGSVSLEQQLEDLQVRNRTYRTSLYARKTGGGFEPGSSAKGVNDEVNLS